jgi:hypothetical protein
MAYVQTGRDLSPPLIMNTLDAHSLAFNILSVRAGRTDDKLSPDLRPRRAYSDHVTPVEVGLCSASGISGGQATKQLAYSNAEAESYIELRPRQTCA